MTAAAPTFPPMIITTQMTAAANILGNDNRPQMTPPRMTADALTSPPMITDTWMDAAPTFPPMLTAATRMTLPG